VWLKVDGGLGRPTPWEYGQAVNPDGAGAWSATIPRFATRAEVYYRDAATGIMAYAEYTASGGFGIVVPTTLGSPDGVPLPPFATQLSGTVGVGDGVAIVWKGTR
jgi:hypothetical protein